jgi:lipid-A-disaccharide synthase
VGLPNILSGEFVVPEFLQDQATPQALAEATIYWLDCKAADPTVLRGLETRFDALHERLRRDTGTLAAQAIDNMLHA